MASATLPSHDLHFCFFSSSSKFSITTKQVWLNYPKRNRLSLVFCSSSTSLPPPSSSSPPQVSEPNPTAVSGVNAALDLFSKGRVKYALVLFDTAVTLNPNPVEAQAAFYNKACCHAYRGEGKKAAECLRTALKEYNLKFGTILNDPDLASFRALPEFKELQGRG